MIPDCHNAEPIADCLDSAALEVNPSCMYCGGSRGHSEVIETGDEGSYCEHEVWFCCHACRDAGKPCETFHRIPEPDNDA